MNRIVSYAQNNEDILLWRALSYIKNGKYIDVGAFHPREDSVTSLFYERGWSGINIEPYTDYFQLLNIERPRDINLNCGIAAKKGSTIFYQVKETGLSTIHKPTVSDLEDTHLVEEKIIQVDTLNNIIDEHHFTTIHFLKVDVEGAEKAVLEGINLQKYRPYIIIVESNRPNSTEQNHQVWETNLLEAKYRFAYYDGLNRFYLANEHYEKLIPAFSVPVNIMDGFIPYQRTKALAALEERERTILLLRHSITELTNSITAKKHLSTDEFRLKEPITEIGALGELQILRNHCLGLINAAEHLFLENQDLNALRQQFEQIEQLTQQSQQQQQLLLAAEESVREERKTAAATIKFIQEERKELKESLTEMRRGWRKLKKALKEVRRERQSQIEQQEQFFIQTASEKGRLYDLLAQKTKEVAFQQAEYLALKTKNEVLVQQIAGQEQTIAGQEQTITELNQQVHETRQQLQHSKSVAQQYELSQRQSNEAKNHLSLRVEALEKSLSWRLTAPLRWLLAIPMRMLREDKPLVNPSKITIDASTNIPMDSMSQVASPLKQSTIPHLETQTIEYPNAVSTIDKKVYNNILDFVPQAALQNFINNH